MTKRRRSSGGKRTADGRFWYGGPAHEAQDPGEAGSSTADSSLTGSSLTGSSLTGSSLTGSSLTDGGARTIRPTPDPGALVRSLGAAPLALDSSLVERHLSAVYEEAVRTATALAAANGLLEGDPDE